MWISIEVVPRSPEDLQSELDYIRDELPTVNAVNIPDLMRMPIRSWDACSHVRSEVPRLSPIPHFRSIDFDLKKPFPFAEKLRESGVKEVIVVTGDPPVDMSRKVYPTSCIELMRKFKRELPEIKVYGGLDPYRSSLRSELEYLERKQEAGAEGFFTQPYFDVRLMEVFAEMFEQSECRDLPVVWGITSVVGQRSRNYWETRNRAIFPRHFQPTLEWNRNFAREAIQWAGQNGGHLYIMPIKVKVKDYLEGILPSGQD
ncbi:methylenetetrahydrofolate reductase [Deinococcus roseus]|uniref:Methylenetetrahydrofolate reductase n=1 Tax=Deinococcus roseus TaxID=392414 RepID=A0ABQ2CUV7_9DEIO|nr:methylenetetrahydrofolate reductase [Deinococcus roseus]GGJ23065.1 methylenetetrahydrofolate reductase [Deinococcus roseus]